MTDATRALFAAQADDCAAMGSGFSARLLRLVPDVLDPATRLGRRIFGFGAVRADAVPLRLAGALHACARAGDADLAAVYPPNVVGDSSLLAALAAVLIRREDDLLPWLDGPPQTNEVARSAVLIAAGHWLTARYAMPLHLSELGASAGLNLLWDHYGLDLPDLRLGPSDAALTLTPAWTGRLPLHAAPTVLERAGVDLSPLDPARDRDRMLAYIWPDQTERLARAAAALTLAARLRPVVVRGDAGDWARGALARPRPGAVHLIYHTIARQYFPAATRQTLGRALADAGAKASPDAPLAHLAMEADAISNGAGLTLTLWPGGQTIALGRADFHGRWVDWHAPAP